MSKIEALCLALLFCHPYGATAAAAEPHTAPMSQQVELPPRQVIGDVRLQAKVVLLGMKQHFPQESWVAVEQRVAAELKRLGLRMVRAPARATKLDERMAELGAQAANHRAIAAMRIVRRRGAREVQLWVYDALTQKMLLRRTKAVESTVGADAMVALRVVELLEASLIEIRMRRRQKLASGAPRAAIPASVRKIVATRLEATPAERSWRASVGLGLSTNIGGAGVLAGATLAIGWRWRPWLALNGEAFIPFTVHTSTLSGGDEVDYRAFQLRAGAEVEPWSAHWFSPSAGIAAGTLIAHVQGRAVAPAVNHSDLTAVALVSGLLRARVRLRPLLSLLASVAWSVTIPRVDVHLGEQIATSAGRPLFDATLAAEWCW